MIDTSCLAYDRRRDGRGIGWWREGGENITPIRLVRFRRILRKVSGSLKKREGRVKDICQSYEQINPLNKGRAVTRWMGG